MKKTISGRYGFWLTLNVVNGKIAVDISPWSGRDEVYRALKARINRRIKKQKIAS